MYSQTMNPIEKLLDPITLSRFNAKYNLTKANRMPSANIGNSRGRTVGVQVNDKNVLKRKSQRINQSPWSTLLTNPKGKTVCTQANKIQHIRQLQRASHIQIVSILGQDSPELKQINFSVHNASSGKKQKEHTRLKKAHPKCNNPQLQFLEQELPSIESSHSSSPKSSFESSENSDSEKTLYSTSSEKTSETESNTEKPRNYQFEIVKKISDEFVESARSSKYDSISSKINKIKTNLTIEKSSQFEVVNEESNNFPKKKENTLIPLLEKIVGSPEKIETLSQLRKIHSKFSKNNFKRSHSVDSQFRANKHFDFLNQNDVNKLINRLENNVLSNESSKEVTKAADPTIFKKIHLNISQSHNEFNHVSSKEHMDSDKLEDISPEQEIPLHIERIENQYNGVITTGDKLEKENQEKGDGKEMKNSLLEAIDTLTFQELVQLLPLVALRLDLQPSITSNQKLKLFRKVLKILTQALSSNKID